MKIHTFRSSATVGEPVSRGVMPCPTSDSPWGPLKAWPRVAQVLTAENPRATMSAMETPEEWAASLVADVETRKAEIAEADGFVEKMWPEAVEEARAKAEELNPLVMATLNAFGNAFPRSHVGVHGSPPPQSVARAEDWPPHKDLTVVVFGNTFLMSASTEGVSCDGGGPVPVDAAVAHLRNWLRSLVMPPAPQTRF